MSAMVTRRVIRVIGLVCSLLAFSAGATTSTPSAAPAVKPADTTTVKVIFDESKARPNPVSPFIFGINQYATDSLYWNISTICRWGGDHTSRYNWKTDCSNSGFNWYFRNWGPDDPPPFKERSFSKFFENNMSHDLKTAVTVPMIGWIAKDSSSGSYPVSIYPDQEQVAEGFGNGMTKDHKPIIADPLRTSMKVDADYFAGWFKKLDKTYGRYPDYYLLDNENGIWHSTHRDIHPEYCSYDELWSRTVEWASMIKKVDPKAKIFLGGGDLVFSAADMSPTGKWLDGNDASADTKKHYPGVAIKRDFGTLYLLKWYMTKIKEYEKEHGVQLVDGIDIHVYPQVFTSGDQVDQVTMGDYWEKNKNDSMAYQRLQAVATLYDTNYIPDHTWIKPPRLVSMATFERVKRAINEVYPKFKIAMGEYNFGGTNHISGALAVADILGVCMDYNLEYATMWGFPKHQSPMFSLYKLFVNYDNKKSVSGGRYLKLSSPDTDVRLHGLADTKISHLFVINRNPHQAKKMQIDAKGFKSGHLYRVDETTLGDVKDLGELPVTSGALAFTAVPYSATHIVLAR